MFVKKFWCFSQSVVTNRVRVTVSVNVIVKCYRLKSCLKRENVGSISKEDSFLNSGTCRERTVFSCPSPALL